jgi:hypothetical protein
VFLSFGPRLPAEVGYGAATWSRASPPREESSGAAMCSSTPDLASLPRWAPVLPRGLGPRLPKRRASALPCVPQLRTSPPYQGGLWRCHVSHGSGLCLPERRAPVLPRTPQPQRAVDHRNKERSSCPRHAAGLACFQSTLACYRGACKTCGQTATVRFNSTT